jgi:hypothetical protein
MTHLRLVSLVSGVYDILLGTGFLLGAAQMAALFGVPAPQPAVLGDTNGLFLLSVGIGYWLPFRDPRRWRAYLWVMGPFLKFGGAAVFLRDFLLRDSPAVFLLFAASDGLLALWTLMALLGNRAGPRAARG